MVATATRTLLENLDRIPNEEDETRVSILAFDTSLYFFSIQVGDLVGALVISSYVLQPGSTDSTMLVVSDIDDVFLPTHHDLLVNLTESRAALEALLEKLNDMFARDCVTGSALGPALQAGFELVVG